MRRIHLILALTFIISAGKIAAQENGTTSAKNHPQIQTLFALSDTILSGEIHFVINHHKKEESAIETTEYKMTFSKRKKTGCYLCDFNFWYNLLNVTDSLQYVYNGKKWFIIDHKKKLCIVDSDYQKIADWQPFSYPSALFFNEMIRFYTGRYLDLSFLSTTVKDVQKTGDRTLVRLENEFPVDALMYCYCCNKKQLYIEEYEWDAGKFLLLRHSQEAKDCPQKAVIKVETLLMDASLNDEKYRDAELYDGLNYAQSYKIKIQSYKVKRSVKINYDKYR